MNFQLFVERLIWPLELAYNECASQFLSVRRRPRRHFYWLVSSESSAFESTSANRAYQLRLLSVYKELREKKGEE